MGTLLELISQVSDNNDTNENSTQTNGWIGNKNNQHDLSVSDYQCMCPGCANGLFETNNLADTTINDPIDTTTNSNSSSTNVSDNPPIDAILSGQQWTIGTDRILTYSFYEDDVFKGAYYGSQTGVKEVSQAIKTNVREIIGWLENIINIDFQEVKETNTNTFGKVRFMDSDSPSYAYAYYPNNSKYSHMGGDVHFSSKYDRLGDNNGFQHKAGKHGYMSIIHEFGHALGLQHTHTGNLDSSLDNTDSSVMTYNFTGNSAGTFMPLDIKALQSMYGAKQHNTGDTTYTFDGYIDRLMVNGNLVLNTSNRTKQTIWDSAGIDTLDFSGLNYESNGYELDLNPGGLLSKTFSKTTSYATAIAYDVAIEKVINSSSNDFIYLNDAANVIKGYRVDRATGNDVLYNGTSQDTLQLVYDIKEVTKSQSGNDLVLGLGSNGSIKLVDYYLNTNNQVKIVYGSGSDQSTNNSPPSFSISDAQIVEGNSGSKQLVFEVTLDNQTNSAISVNYSTADGSATTGDKDYQATNGTLNFSGKAGETQTITVNINGDTKVEGDETFFINLFNNSGDTLAEGIGTILNDDKTQPTGLNLSINGTEQTFTPESFDGNQQDRVKITLNDDTLKMVGNGWLKTHLNYTITEDTVLAFEFRSTAKGEIHGIGFDTDDNKTPSTHFQLYGSQNWGEAFGNYAGDGNWQSYTINVGDFFKGDYKYLTFANDHDVKNPTASSEFRNIQLFEDTPEVLPSLSISDAQIVEGNSGSKQLVFEVTLDNQTNSAISVNYSTADGSATTGDKDYQATNGTLNFSGKAGETQTITVNINGDTKVEGDETFFINLFNNSGDTLAEGIGTILNDDKTQPTGLNLSINGTEQTFTPESFDGNQQDRVKITLNDDTLKMVGNGWLKTHLNYTITEDTVLAFEFRSTAKGEIHGIGFDTDDNKTPSTHFQLYGSQNWGEAFGNYAGDGNWQSYTINVGDFFKGDYKYLTFANDHDVKNPTASSEFRNIQLFEKTSSSSNIVSDTSSNSNTRTQQILAQILDQADIDLTGVKNQQQLVGQQALVKREFGTTGADTFVLGDDLQSHHAQSGYQDFALIEGFNQQQGDVLQLHGDANLYEIVSLGSDQYQGSAIFYTANNSNDLIGIVSGVESLSLDSQAISFA